MNSEHILKDSIFKIGEVISVDGRRVKVSVNKMKNSSHTMYKGELLKNISVGSYIKIIKGFTKIIGKVEGEFVDEDKSYTEKNYKKESDKIRRTLVVSMLGFFKGERFERGIKELPLVYDECFLLDNDEFRRVHDFIKDGDEPLELGHLSLEKGQVINIGVNSLFASHIGIFGNTGSGKSYTLAKIYEGLFKKYKEQNGFRDNATFYLFDFNGEYINKNTDEEDNVIVDFEYKNIYDLSTRAKRNNDNKFPINENEISDVNFWAIYLSATEKTQTPFLKRALANDFCFSRFDTENNFKLCISNTIESLITKKVDKSDILQFLREVGSALKNKIENINTLIDDYQEHLKWHSSSLKFYYENQGTTYDNEDSFVQNIIKEKVSDLSVDIQNLTYFEKIRLRIIFRYYHELAKFDLNSEHISPLLKRLKKIEDLDKVLKVDNAESDTNFNVISLKDVNMEMKKVLPLLICKQIYEKKKLENDRTKYLNIIIDEAHNILSHISNRESETWKDYRLETFEEIIKEGRKFGVFLTIASQRPSDISSTIISQLHNYFLHRLINNKDIEAVEKTISYLDKVSFEYLPILPTGTCIFAGLSAQVPVVIDIGEIEDGYEPKSETIKLIQNWNS
jgi:DNA helicase HerA-like ATPase